MSIHLNNITNKEYSRKLQKSARIDQEKRHKFYLKHKCSEDERGKNDTFTNDKTPDIFKYAWPAETCIRVGESIQT